MLTTKSALVIIDSAVENYDVLLAGVSPEAWVAVLERDRDGVAQITALLQSLPNVGEVHIVSHGSPGTLYLGNVELSLATLEHYGPVLALWGVPSLLLYGCSVATGDAGEEFVAKLHHLTGAEIAASSSLTGHADRGGNWELDVVLGGKAPALAIAPEAREAYPGVLASLVFQNQVLESGSDLQAGAIYRYSNVTTGLDALVTIEAINNGAVLSILDDTSFGDLNAFQPEIGGPTGSSVDFSIAFVQAGTNTPTAAPDFLATWVDLDGDPSFQEFGELSGFTDLTVESNTALTVSGAGGSRQFIGADFTIDGISTTSTEVMATASYTGVTGFTLRAGINGGTSPNQRLFSLNFDEGLLNNYADPQTTTVVDTDGDGVEDAIDLDDDNDGILDRDEGLRVARTGPWDVSTPNQASATLDLGNGVTAVVTNTGNNFTNGQLNPAGDDVAAEQFWTEPDLAGANSLQNVYSFDPAPEVTTFSFVDSTTGDPISVTDPIIHVDRLGGFVNGTANSATVTLLGGLTWRKLAGTLDFSTTSTTATDASAGQAQANPSESNWQVAGGTASGSLQVQGTVSSFQLQFVPNGPLGIGDGIELVLDVPGIEGVTGQDTDGDGIADHLDLDSDNDGISDLTEALPSGTDIAVVDGDGDGRYDLAGTQTTNPNVDDNYTADGVATAANAGAGNTPVNSDTDGISDVTDLDSDNDGIADAVEAQATAGYTSPAGPQDANGVNATSLFTPVDTDGDLLADYRDTDSDDDTLTDSAESGLTLSGTDDNGDGIHDDASIGASYADPDGVVNAPINDLANADTDPSDADFRSLNNDAPIAEDDAFTTDEDTVLSGDVLVANPTTADSDPEGDTLTVTEINGNAADINTPLPLASGAIVTLNSDGTYSYDPNSAFEGLGATETATDSFAYTLSDGNGGTDTATVTITITGADDPPALDLDDDNDSGAVDPNSQTTFNPRLSLLAASEPVAIATDPVITDIDSTNIESATITLTNAQAGDVLSGAALPGGTNISVNPASTATNILLTGSGTLAEYQAAIAAVTFDNPNLLVDPTTRFIDVVVNDGTTNSNVATTAIEIIDADDQPTAVDDTPTVDEDAVLTGDLSTNDTPSSDGGNVWSLETQAANGTAVVNTDGTYSYTPNANFNGSDSFTYTITDFDGDTSTATANVTVNPINDAPVAEDDAFTTGEDTESAPIDLLANDTDLDGDTLAVEAIAGTALTPGTAQNIAVANGTVNVSDAGVVTFTPDANYNGPATFDYVVTDGIETVTASVNGTVDPVNDDPIAADDAYTVTEDTPFTATLGTDDLLQNDSDLDGDTLTVSTTPVTAPANGAVVLNADGTFEYTPNADFTGTDSFVYEVSDGNGGTAQATVNLTIDPVNDAPVAGDVALTVDEETIGTALGLTAPADADGDTLAVTVTGLPTLGVVTLADSTPVTNGQPLTVAQLEGLLYDAPDDYDGAADPGDFTYSVTDGTETVTGTADITVNPINDPPVASDVAIAVDEESLGTPLGLALPTDADGDALIITVTGLPALGAVTLADGTPITNGQALTEAELTGLLYNAPDDYDGVTNPGEFTYSVNDGAEIDTGAVDITINPVNDAPTAGSAVATVDEESLGTPLGLAAPTDADGDALTITVTGLPTLGEVTLADGTPVTNGQTLTPVELTNLLYNAPADYDGVADPGDFTYDVFDGTDTVTGTADITVNPVNDAPIPGNTIITVDEASADTPLALTAPTDADGDALTITVSGLPTLGEVTLADGTPVTNGQVLTAVELEGLQYDAPADFDGTTDPGDFTYEVFDGTVTVTGTTDVAINTPLNDPPTAGDGAVTAAEESVGTALGLAAPTDPDGDPLTVTVTGLPTLGEITLADGTALTDGQTLTPAEVAGLLYDAPAEYDGVADPGDFTYSVFDGTDTVTGTVDIAVTPVNDTPVAGNAAIAVNEESVGTALGLVAPTDADGDALTITITGLPALGGVTLADGTPVTGGQTLTEAELTGLLYNAPAEYDGVTDPGDFTYSVFDGTDTV
ncbi:MAG: Ig-like domain-containing protein, partial [Elainellaceae cyanobacterium]